MKYLLDTNAISEVVSRQPNEGVIRWIGNLSEDSVYLSVITIGEIQHGIEKLPHSRRKESLRAWLFDDLLYRFEGRVLTLTIGDMLEWGAMVSDLKKSSGTLPQIDSLIAATAKFNDCTVVTRNEADFVRAGVRVANPWLL